MTKLGDAYKKKMTREELNAKQMESSNSTSKLLYSDFMRIVLDFQLKEHERFL